jgi:hypothetical protein
VRGEYTKISKRGHGCGSQRSWVGSSLKDRWLAASVGPVWK